MDAADIRKQLKACSNPERALTCQRFFKTGRGDYAEGDLFWGIATPQLREIAKKNANLSLPEVEKLIHDPVHEVRACALFILVRQSQRADDARFSEIISVYLRNTRWVNNWDLVDTSCILLGRWLQDKPRDLLYRLAESPVLWEQRLAVVSTLVFIKQGDFTDCLHLTERLLSHQHDLIHKALGWMLREIGKKDKPTLERFLQQNLKALPRTTLRYAIERFSEMERRRWLAK